MVRHAVWVWLTLVGSATGLARASSMDDCNHAWQLIGQQRNAEAIALLQQVIAQDSTLDRAYTLVAEAYADDRRLEDGERYFRLLIHPGEPHALAEYALGLIAKYREDFAQATSHFAQCIRQNPSQRVCYWKIGQVLQYSTHNSAVPEDLRARIPLDPGNPYTYVAIAAIYAYREDRAKEESALQKTLELAGSDGDGEFRADLEVELGGTYIAIQDFDKALAHLEVGLRFYEAKNDWQRKAEITHQIATSAVRDPERAVALHQSLLGFCREIGHWTCEAEEVLSLGNAYQLKGDLDTALSYYGNARSSFEKLSRPVWLLKVLSGIASAHIDQGDMPAARANYEEALNLAIALKSPPNEAYALRGLGNVCELAGDYFQAITYQSESVKILKQQGFQHTAGAGVGNIGDIYASLGDTETARARYQESLDSARNHSDGGEEQSNLTRLGAIYLKTGQPRAAMRFLQEAMELSERVKYLPFRIDTLLSLGAAYRQLREFDAAGAALESALKLSQDTHTPAAEAEALIELGRCALDQRRWDAAESRFLAGLDAARRSGAPHLVLAAQRGLGEVRIRLGQYQRALESLTAAVEVIESLRSRVPSPDLRSDFVRDNWKVYEDIVDVLSILHERQPGRGYGREAFYFAERGRARSFLDLLAESRAHVTRGLTPEQVKQQAMIDRELSKALAALVADNSERNERAVKEAERKLANWSLELRQTNPRYQQLQFPEPSRPQELSPVLARQGIVLLEYALGERRSLVWVVDGRQTRLISLPGRALITREVTAFRRLIAAKPESADDLRAVSEQSGRLYDLLFKPVQPLVAAAQRLLVVPDGILYYLPFEALAAGAGESKPLIETYTITYAPSATAWVSLLQEDTRRHHPAPRRELLAYANPALRGTSTSQPAATVRGVYERGGYRFAPLPNTEKEVEAIARLYPANLSKVRVGVAATESSVKSEKLTGYKRIHFATHAVLDEQTPARSGIVLSLVNTGEEDGILRMNEILNLELDADLVVLSACQTGLGKLIRGEGLIGLTRAFLYAGSPRVAVSLWEVNDVATAEFMKIFYSKMNQGSSPSLALRQAKLEMLHSGPLAYRHPYFWAPFVLVGLL